MVLVIAEMVAHLRLERGFHHLLGELVQQAAGTDEFNSRLPRLRQELLGQLLLILGPHSCVSHGLSDAVSETGAGGRDVTQNWSAG